MTADLGKIVVQPKGEYLPGIGYEVLDIVSYEGSSYLALKDTAVKPSNDGLNWMLLAKKGDDGKQGEKGENGDKSDGYVELFPLAIEIGESDVVIYDGNNEQVITITKESLGLGEVDNTSDEDKPISRAVGEVLNAIMSDFERLQSDFEQTLANTGVEGHSHTKEELGLGNVDNTRDEDKPISKAVQEALDKITDDLENMDVSEHVHSKEDVGLGNADNTGDMDKPISTAVQAALDKIADDLKDMDVGEHVHSKEDVGLGNVNNTSDMDKPVSTAIQVALTRLESDKANISHSHTSADLPKSTTSSVGIVQLTDTTSSTSTTTAATSASLKVTYDLANNAYNSANNALPKSGGTMTGNLYAYNNTSYTTSQIRNAYFTTSDLTAGSSSLTNGTIVFVYE